METVLEKAGFGLLYRELWAHERGLEKKFGSPSILHSPPARLSQKRDYSFGPPQAPPHPGFFTRLWRALGEPLVEMLLHPMDLVVWILLLPPRLVVWILLLSARLVRFLLSDLARTFRSMILEITEPAVSAEISNASVPVESRAEKSYAKASRHLTLIQWAAGGFSVLLGTIAVSFFLVALIFFVLGENQLGLATTVVTSGTFVGTVAVRPWLPWLEAVRQSSAYSIAFDGYLEEKKVCGADVDCISAAVQRFLENLGYSKAA